MKILYETEIMRFEIVPNVGDIIMLKWLNGDDAYAVRVARVSRDPLRLDVMALL